MSSQEPQPSDTGQHDVSWRTRLLRALGAHWPIRRGTLWTVDVQGMPRGRRLAYKMARVGALTVGGLFDQLLGIRAAGLAFFTLLSVVPFLALAFAVLKGLGAYSQLLETVIWPYVHTNFAGNEPLVAAIQKVLEFVDKTDVGSLGTGGLLFLLYTSGTLLSNIEAILNHEWGVRQGRPLKRKVTDYLTLIVISPILVVSAGTLFAAAQSSEVVAYLQQLLQWTGVWDVALSLVSLAIIFVAITAVYLIIPHTGVRFRSAAVGGLLASVLWQIVLYLQVQLQMGVARYNAIYSGFAAFPIFLFFLWLSWLVVLMGGRLAAHHQMQDLQRARRETPRLTEQAREHIAAVVVAEAVKGAISRGPHPNPQALANRLEVPVPAVQDIVNELARANILARVIAPANEPSDASVIVPAADIDAVHVADVIGALRNGSPADDNGQLPSVAPEIASLLERFEAEAHRLGSEVSLRDLATLAKDATPIPPGTGGKDTAQHD
jgi:membrane protein